MKNNIVLFIVLINCFVFKAKSQTSIEARDYPIIGQPMPDFRLTEVVNFEKKLVSLKDFNGKWLILDFWSKGCKSCFSSFPKINQLQSEFKDQVQFILVAKNDAKSKDIRSIYEKHKVHYNLDLPNAYDTSLFKRFGVWVTPYIIIIDPKGVVYAITYDVNKKNIQALVDGGKPFFKKMILGESKEERGLVGNIREPLLIGGNGGEDMDYLYRSLLSNFRPDIMRQQFVPEIDSDQFKKGMFQGIGLQLRELYNIAFIGKTYWLNEDSLYGNFNMTPVLELKDRSLFQVERMAEKGAYNYSLTVPKEKAGKQYMQEVMQRDLKNYFGYDVSIETRAMPCWNLVLSSDKPKKKIISKNNKQEDGDFITGFTMKKIKYSLGLIHSYHPDEPPFINRTGIEEVENIRVDAIMSDFNDIKRGLQNIGFDLVKGTKEMKVVVIRDPRPEE